MFKKKAQREIKQIGNSRVYSYYAKPRSFKNKPRFANLIKGGLTVLISVLIIFTVVQAATIKITPPTGTPVATFYSLSEIYNFITANTAATLASPALDFSSALEDTGRTLTEIYNKLAALISADKVKIGTTYLNVAGTLVPSGGDATTTDVFSAKTFFGASQSDWNTQTGTLKLACATSTFDGVSNLVATAYDGDGNGSNRWCITDADDITDTDVLSGKIAWINGATTTGTMVDNGAFGLTASSTDQEVAAGYWGAGTLIGDLDLVAGNIANNANIFGVIGNLFGDTVASYVLTTADGGGAAKGTYNASNLSTTTVKKGTTFGVSETGVYSGYPGSGANRADLTQATCVAADNWYWFEDGNGDGDSANPDDPEDGICVYANTAANMPVAGSWNGYDWATNYDATYIAGYTCNGVSFPNGAVASYNGIDSSGNPDTTWNEVDCALCKVDCIDGIKDLPDQGAYTSNNGNITTGYNGPLTPKVLAEWKGTRLPTSADFFGFCGYKDGGSNYENTTSANSSDKTFGNYGVQVGRIDEFLDLADNADTFGWEWLSEQHYSYNARIAGRYACSNFSNSNVNGGYRFRAVFRP